jgi:molybdate transport system substrate-binding protein
MKTILAFLLLTVLGQPVFGEDLKVYAAAAFKAPLTEIATQYEAATGNKVTLIFDTAGGTEQKFREDPQAALLITTAAVIENAEKMGRLKDGTTYRLGDTLAGLAFYPGSKKPDISTPEKLKAALLAAKRVVFSDPARGATAGIHFMKVIESLGVKDEVLRKATLAKDGPDTMRLLLEEKIDLGVTQISEIVQANRDAVVGPFPKEFELATVYSVWYRNSVSQGVRGLVALLNTSGSRTKLAENGIKPVTNP